MDNASIVRVRSATEITAATAMVWEFFDVLRDRYAEMPEVIDAYIADNRVAEHLAEFSRYFGPPAGECFLAQIKGAPVGMVMVKPKGESDGALNRMFVRDSARGLGLGRRLCRAAIDESRALGHEWLYLEALWRHVEALPLYESMGFARFEPAGAFGADDARVIHMRLRHDRDSKVAK